MTRSHPSVSVVIPTYNGAEHLAAAIESVLTQTMNDFEVVVVDDASQDDTAAVAESFSDPRVKVLHNARRLGPEGNWNTALEASSGDLVKVMAQDDLIAPACLERQVAALVAHPEATFASVRRDIIDGSGRTLLRDRGLPRMTGVVARVNALRRMTRSGANIFGEGAAVLMRREPTILSGGFSAIRPYVIDLDMWVRLLSLGPVVAVDATLASFRVSAGAWSVALAREQARQVRGLIDQVRADPANGVTHVDFALGWVRSGINAWLRRAIYTLVARRSGNTME